MKYKVIVYSKDEEDFKFPVGSTIVTAKNKPEATKKALDELWDERLTAANQTPYVEVENLNKKVNEGDPYLVDVYLHIKYTVPEAKACIDKAIEHIFQEIKEKGSELIAIDSSLEPVTEVPDEFWDIYYEE